MECQKAVLSGHGFSCVRSLTFVRAPAPKFLEMTWVIVYEHSGFVIWYVRSVIHARH